MKSLIPLSIALFLLITMIRGQQIGNVTFGQFGTAYLVEEPATLTFLLAGGRYVEATYETVETPVHFVAIHTDNNPLLRRCDQCTDNSGGNNYNNGTESVYVPPGVPLDYFTIYLFYDRTSFFNGTISYKYIFSDLNPGLCEGEQGGNRREISVYAFVRDTWTELPFPSENFADRATITFDSDLTAQLGVALRQGINLVVTSINRST